MPRQIHITLEAKHYDDGRNQSTPLNIRLPISIGYRCINFNFSSPNETLQTTQYESISVSRRGLRSEVPAIFSWIGFRSPAGLLRLLTNLIYLCSQSLMHDSCLLIWINDFVNTADEDDKGSAMVEIETRGIDLVDSETEMMMMISEEGLLEDEEQCAVCLEKLPVGSGLSRLPCFHVYHGACIDRWLENTNTCPLCRRPVPFVAVSSC